MSQQITQEETKQLFQFCRKHYVYHYDVQIELVDHLASSIEEQWIENPILDFNKALKNSFKKFGVYGFSKIKTQKEKELKKKYNRLLWHFMLDYYRWPKVLSTFVFTLGLFLLFQITNHFIWLIVAYSSLLFIGIILYHFFMLKKLKINTIAGKTFLLTEQFKRITSVYAVVIQVPNLTFQLFNLTRTRSIENQWILLAISFFMVAFTVLLYGNFFYLPKKIKEHFLEQFAEFAQ